MLLTNISFMPVCFVIFQPVHNADFIVPVEIDGTIHQVSYYFAKVLQPSVFKLLHNQLMLYSIHSQLM